MQFLQISEPEEKNTLNPSGYAIGIDLGTTNSVVACVVNGKAEVLGPILPSVYEGIRSIKRLMGGNERIKDLTPVEISAQILSSLKDQAEAILQEKVSKAVITVPAHFDDAARNATKLAANLAGLEVLRLINEPTAAAVAYGLDHEAEGLYLIYDFGGGTFDVSILKMQKGIFQVLATGGDVSLGGDDIDKQIIKYLNAAPEMQLLGQEAKEYLTKEIFWQNGNYSLSRAQLEQIALPFVARSIKICQETIINSKINPSEIKEIVLVGGSTRMPLVTQMITEAIKPPLDNINPDLVVAIGAAIQADSLIHGSNNLLLDVTSLSIGLEVMGGMNERIINKNSSIPASVTKYFTTYQDGQTGIVFHIVQGEREMVADCRSLARFELKNIPPMKAGAAKVAVTFIVDADGLLTVSAKEEVSNIKQQIEVKPTYGLSEAEVEEMIIQSYVNAKQDILAKQLSENRLQADANIKNITAAIEEDSDLLTIEDKAIILALINELENVISSDDLAVIEAANQAVEDKAASFLQARLNRQVKLALQGRLTTEIIKKYDNISKTISNNI